MRIGAVTRYTQSVLLGVAKVFCGLSSTHIATATQVFTYTSTNSVGALASTEFSFSEEFQEVDVLGKRDRKIIPLRTQVSLSVQFQEITVRNLAISMGLNPVSTTYNKILTGSIPLGLDGDPTELRVEAVCVYPDQNNYMAIIFPKAIVRMQASMSPTNTDGTNLNAVFESRYADAIHGGNAAWDTMPTGVILFGTFTG